jgi:hypothetical protein
MNCEDYKEAFAADPGFGDESGHVDECASCQDFRAEIQALNEAISAAMKIDVPEIKLPELPPIEVANVVALPDRRIQSRPVWFALAATVLIAAVVGIQITGNGDTQGTLQEQVLAHLDHESAAMRLSDSPVSASDLDRAMPESVATMNHDAGLITYAQSCRINGKIVPHLVIQGENGPVTILLMPDEMITEALSLDGINIKGVILPVGDGSIAIIGDRDGNIEDVQQYVLNSVTWST